MNILITAGPTREPIDAVRVLTNRSSGQMGCSVASAASNRGHRVHLLLSHAATIKAPECELTTQHFNSTADLDHLLDRHFEDTDVLIMAAAVSDFIPESFTEDGKLNRKEGATNLRLNPAPDLVAKLARMKRPGQIIIGFALEPSTEMEERATRKMREKGLDAIVANPLETMESAKISGILLTADGKRWEAAAELDKAAFAEWLLDHVEDLSSRSVKAC